jgi:hypothetical protein
MIIMGIDPSSTITGYAVKLDKALVEAGLIRPSRHGIVSFERICEMRIDLNILLDKFRPAIVLVEWTRGKVGIRRHQGRGAGLAVYGAGVGAIATQAEIWCEKNSAVLYPVNENDWTRRIPKEDRQAVIAAQYPEYKINEDPGGDIADAIGLVDWWQKEQLIK